MSLFFSLFSSANTPCHYIPELSLADLRATDISVYLWRSLLRHFLTPTSLSGTLKELIPQNAAHSNHKHQAIHKKVRKVAILCGRYKNTLGI